MAEQYQESEMSKLVKKLMDEEGFEFGEAVKEAMKRTRKENAAGGMMREKYAEGTPEGGEGKQFLLNKKYLELLKEYSEAGVPNADSKALKEANEYVRRIKFAKGSMDQESGIMKLDEAKMMAYEPGDYNKDKYDPAMVDEYEKYKYDMQEQRPGMPIMTIDEFIRMEMKDISKKRKAPSIKMAEADFDPLMDEYMKYLDEMKEIDKPPMSLREFEAEARLGVRGGGLAYLMGM